MAWQDRLKEAAYNTPSGRRFTFAYENVGKSVSKKTSAFNFPDADGTYIQDLGHSGRRYPFRLIFWGDDHDLEAQAFEDGLLEKGPGKLEHPLYPVALDVVPFGDITRRDDLKTAANQSILEVQFWETIDLLFPSAQADPAAEVLTAVVEYNSSAAAQFEGELDLDTASETASFKSRYSAVLDVTKSGLKAVAETQDDVERQFNAVFDSIDSSIDTLVSEPLTLATQTLILIQTPARALTSIQARLSAYSDMAQGLISGDDAVRTPSLNAENSNAFRNDSLYASTAVTGAIISVVNNIFETKPDAIAAAEEILDLAGQVNTWRDDNLVSLSEIDTGEAYQQLQEAVALAAGFLVQISFSLKQERRIVLDRNRTIIDLAAELYGEVDTRLDFLINSNSLTGSEILELPAGKEIVYFV